MALGSHTREIAYNKPAAEAFRDVVQAFCSIGRVDSVGNATMTVVGKARYGLQSVTLRVSVMPSEGMSLVQIMGSSDDVWGGGANKVMDRFIQSLEGVGSRPPTVTLQATPPPPPVEEKIKVFCPLCSEPYSVTADWAGRRFECSKCGDMIKVPGK